VAMEPVPELSFHLLIAMGETAAREWLRKSQERNRPNPSNMKAR